MDVDVYSKADIRSGATALFAWLPDLDGFRVVWAFRGAKIDGEVSLAA